jgi:prepilin-type N-terminal cleavage/methylation domain-containing protein
VVKPLKIERWTWNVERWTVARMHASSRGNAHAFSLIELLVVITIIVVLMGLLFPAFRGVQDQAKRTQAKNDLTQIVTAVNAFYTEYGKYPPPATGGSNITVGGSGGESSSKTLFDPLRGLDLTSNPKQIAFFNPPEVKDAANLRGGVKSANGAFYDPWGTPYAVRIDGDYDNILPNPYTTDTGAGPTDLRNGVIAWSLGKDQAGGSGDKKTGTAEDDVI